MTKLLFADYDKDGNIPLIISDLGSDLIDIEIRSIYKGVHHGAIYCLIDREQASRLRDALNSWLDDPSFEGIKESHVKE